MTFRLESGHVGPLLRVAYSHADQPIEQEILLQTTLPRFGGVRWWFSCPMAPKDGRRCNRRVARLYLPPGGTLGCRTCHRLVYGSSRESHRWDLLIRRAGWTIEEGLRYLREAINQKAPRRRRKRQSPAW
jgi:hypothetical protein